MPNGRKGDHSLTDILQWKIRRFSERADELIVEIVQLGGRLELERTFNLLAPPPPQEFEQSLQEMRDRLRDDRKQRGWEV